MLLQMVPHNVVGQYARVVVVEKLIQYEDDANTVQKAEDRKRQETLP